MRIIAFALFVTFSTLLQADIKSTSTMEEILPEITADTLVLFDVDDTLVHPTVFVTHRKWKTWMRTQLAVLYPNDKHLQEEIYGTTNLVTYLQVPLTLVDTKTPPLIEALQKRGIEVFALTLRGQKFWYSYPVSGMSKRTIAQLHQAGYHFEKTKLKHPFDACPAFEEGIFFTSAKNKGPFLIELFKMIGYRPTKVVFIDDHADQVESVMDTLEKEGITCVGFHYTASSDKPFNFGGCMMQFKKMYEERVIVSNEEALQSASGHENVEPLHYFLDYITNHHQKLKHAILDEKP